MNGSTSLVEKKWLVLNHFEGRVLKISNVKCFEYRKNIRNRREKKTKLGDTALSQFISTVEKNFLIGETEIEKYDRIVREARQIAIKVSRAKFRPETMTSVARKKSRVDRRVLPSVRCDKRNSVRSNRGRVAYTHCINCRVDVKFDKRTLISRVARVRWTKEAGGISYRALSLLVDDEGIADEE